MKQIFLISLNCHQSTALIFIISQNRVIKIEVHSFIQQHVDDDDGSCQKTYQIILSRYIHPMVASSHSKKRNADGRTTDEGDIFLYFVSLMSSSNWCQLMLKKYFVLQVVHVCPFVEWMRGIWWTPGGVHSIFNAFSIHRVHTEHRHV